MIDRIIEIISDFVEVDLSEINADSKIRSDVGLNSFDLVNVAVEIEREFGITIPDVEIASIKTLGDLVDLVAEKQAAK